MKSEVEGMSFDKSHVEAEILSIANPKKAEAIMKAKREEEERQREEERIKEEQERLIKESIDAERAKNMELHRPILQRNQERCQA